MSTIIPETLPKPDFRKDIKSILLLFSLYILQGIPLGLILTVPFLLQSQGVLYKDQAKFSLAFWPFSLKVLYAPIIDAIYYKGLGRRKSWLIPLQYLIALFLVILSWKVDDLFSAKDVTALTVMFFMLNFLAASQDVAVDGWALTMLSPENVGYASTCNAVGQTLGFVMGYSGFLSLESANFANKFRSEPLDHGLVTFPQFLLFWAIVFAVTTTLVLIFKEEKKESSEVSEQHMDVVASYKNLWKILKLRNIQQLAIFLLTVRIGTAATDSMARLKLVDAGIPKETLAFFSIPLIPLKLLLPVLLSKWTVGSKPMKLYIKAVPISLCFAIIFPVLIFWTPSFKSETTKEYPFWFFVFLFVVFALELVPGYVRFVTGMGFAAKVSDPAVGGTYMTLINTISNVGGTWPGTLALWLVDYVAITLGKCDSSSVRSHIPPFNVSNFEDFQNEDELTSGISDINTNTTEAYFPDKIDNITRGGFGNDSAAFDCSVKIDGYYVESVVFVIIGFLWLFWGRSTITRLQDRPRSTWKVSSLQTEIQSDCEIDEQKYLNN